jgi:hypothetical protein
MPELDDDALFGEDADDELDDDQRFRADDEDEDEEDGPEDLEEELLDGDAKKTEKPANSKGKAEEKGEKRGGGDGKTVTLSAKEYREIQQRLREKETEEAYWRGKAESKGRKSGGDEDEGESDPPVRKAKPAPTKPDDDDAEAFLVDINKRGMKAIRERGLVSRDEVEALVEERHCIPMRN